MLYMNSNNNFSSLNIELTQDEREALAYLNSTNKSWAEHFNSMLMPSRDKITQRLITSLHREDLVNSREQSKIVAISNLPYSLHTNCDQVLKIFFPTTDKTLYAPISGIHAFDRIDVQGPFYITNQHQIQRVLHPEAILNLILSEAPHLNNEASEQFLDDINNSAANMAIALSFQTYQLTDVTTPLFELINQHQDPYLRSEQAVIEGHPLHPGAKLRKGMSPATTINYSSEFGHPIPMHFVLIAKDIAKVATLDGEYNATIYHQFKGLHDEALKHVSTQQLEQYNVMAIHPWQYDNILLKEYQQELKSGQIIPLQYDINYFAGLSFRTLMPESPIATPHIKLSTNVHITGEIRTLSEQTTINGPQVTAILNNIKATDPLFSKIEADTIDEITGIHFYHPSDTADVQVQRSEQLGTLFRTNINQMISSDTVPLIPSSLVATHPSNDETPLVSLIKLYKAQRQIESFNSASIEWFKQYSQAILDITLPLVVKYGIAMEAHLQNTIASFNQDGSLNKMYIRDFEGLRIDKSQLNQAGYSTEHFHEKSLILTDSKTTVFNKMFYSTIQNHLGELIASIAKSCDDREIESTIWSEISDIIDVKLNQIAHSMSDSEQSNIDAIRETIFAPQIDYKCVTTMRLEDEADYYTYIQVKNPLVRK